MLFHIHIRSKLFHVCPWLSVDLLLILHARMAREPMLSISLYECVYKLDTATANACSPITSSFLLWISWCLPAGTLWISIHFGFGNHVKKGVAKNSHEVVQNIPACRLMGRGPMIRGRRPWKADRRGLRPPEIEGLKPPYGHALRAFRHGGGSNPSKRTFHVISVIFQAYPGTNQVL